MYLTLRLRDGSGSEIPGNAPDTCWLFAVKNFSPVDQEWLTFEARIGTGSPYPLPASARTMSIGAIVNADPANRRMAGNRIFEFQGLTILHGDRASVADSAATVADGAVTTGKISDGTILNADINPDAAIAGTKINPNFGAQDIITAGNISIGGRYRDKTGFLVPVGTVLPFAGGTAPDGWLICNGQAINRSGNYADLFAVIGTTFGAGNGSTTFNVPDLRRRVPVGAGGTGTGILGNAVGNAGGAETHTLTAAEMPSHNHNPGGNYHNLVLVDGNGTSTQTDYSAYEINLLSARQIATNGGDQPHNNVQPSLILNYIIKY